MLQKLEKNIILEEPKTKDDDKTTTCDNPDPILVAQSLILVNNTFNSSVDNMNLDTSLDVYVMGPEETSENHLPDLFFHFDSGQKSKKKGGRKGRKLGKPPLVSKREGNPKISNELQLYGLEYITFQWITENCIILIHCKMRYEFDNALLMVK